MPFKRCLILWSMFLVSQTLSAQTEPKAYAYSLGTSVYKGFIMKHDASIGHLAVSHPQGISLFVNKHTFGKKYCEQVYHYPDIGLAFGYFNYANPILGKSFALSTYLALPVKRFNHSELSFKIGTGIAYHTHPHHPTYNNNNIALGTPITFSMLTSFKYARQLSDVWWGGLSLSLTHFSNGAYSKPNSGINVSTIDFEVSRKIKPVFTERASWTSQSRQYQGIYYYLGASSGLKEIEYGGDKFTFFNLYFQGSKRFNAISAINLGLDAFFDNALKAYIKEEIKDANPDYRRVGVIIGHELFYERLSLLTQIGAYVYRPFKGIYGSLYQRYGLRYMLTDHLVASVCLKTHGGQAEFIEWGFGVKF